MISQSAYLALCKYVNFASENRSECFPEVTIELIKFVKPHVLVIHRPSGRGFYLDRQYRHIVDIKNCQEPENFTKVARQQLPGCGDLPAWAFQLNTHWKPCIEFDTFWLY